MIKFTKEEINLCKQVAEKHRKKIKRGDWIIVDGRIELIGSPYFYLEGKDNKLYKSVGGFLRGKYLGKWFALFSISDCLGWLNQANSFKTQLYNTKWNWYCKTKRYEIGAKEYFAKDKTPLEVCLKVILAVFGEEK